MLEVWEPVAAVIVDMMTVTVHSHALQVQLAPRIGEVENMKRVRKTAGSMAAKNLQCILFINTHKHGQLVNYTRAAVHCVRLLCLVLAVASFQIVIKAQQKEAT